MTKLSKVILAVVAGVAVLPTLALAEGGLMAAKVSADLSKLPISDEVWKSAKEESVSLMAQPMAVPRPKTTGTSAVQVQAIHNGTWVAFRLKWTDTEKSEAGPLGKFSDGVAIQFPMKSDGAPPPVFMGAKDNPVHIFHWRAQYQRDQEKGRAQMTDFYPNMNPDSYPLEFKDHGNLKPISDEQREIFSHGRAAGNPQAYLKAGVDEIVAEGFGTSSVMDPVTAKANGQWSDGKWTVVIARPLQKEGASLIDSARGSFVAFAVWQGGKDEVGSRKSVTMSWLPVQFGH